MLKNRALSGLLWDLGGTFSQHGVTFVISIILARLLSPADFGTVGIALVFIAVSQVFADLGFGSALIQNKENSSIVYSSVFYINICLGFLLFCLFQVLAPAAGAFFNNDDVPIVLRLLSVSFIFSSFNLVQRTILRRGIKFKKLTIRAVFSQLFGGIVGVGCASLGWGVYALVAQHISAAVVNTIILWRVSEWSPKFEFSWAIVKKLSSFSVFAFLDQAMSVLFQRLDTLFVAKSFGVNTLGYYSRAESLNGLLTKYSSASINKVFFPILSSIHDDHRRFEEVYLRLVSLIFFVAFLLTGPLVFWGDIIIVGLFGEKWEPSSAIFQILVLKAFSYPLNSIVINAFLSKGKARENFIVGLFRKSIRLAPLIVGYFYGLMHFLVGMVAVNYLLTFTNILFLSKHLEIPAASQIKKLIGGMGLLLIAFALFKNIVLYNHQIINSTIYTILFLFSYLSLCFLTRNEGLHYLIHNVRSLLKKKNMNLRNLTK